MSSILDKINHACMHNNNELDLSNMNLTTIPYELSKCNVKILKLNNNDIKVIENLPHSLTELYVNNNKIDSIDNHTLPLLAILDISNNNITHIDNLPESLVELYASCNKIKEIPRNRYKYLCKLVINDNKIERLPDLISNNLIYLDVSHNNIKRIDNLIDDIEELYCSYNEIETIDYITTALCTLICNNNKISKFSTSKQNLKELDISHNKLSTFKSEFVPNIIKLNISYNELVNIDYFPLTLKTMDCTNNNFETIPYYDHIPDASVNDGNKIRYGEQVGNESKKIKTTGNDCREIIPIDKPQDVDDNSPNIYNLWDKRKDDTDSNDDCVGFISDDDDDTGHFIHNLFDDKETTHTTVKTNNTTVHYPSHSTTSRAGLGHTHYTNYGTTHHSGYGYNTHSFTSSYMSWKKRDPNYIILKETITL